ncbi:uncharacterized protein [Aegilops tauschii subsp. strangulata]|uniref:uncharacterized protein n=1 Tax=Aegilops tauschii subsp. strangulata TaxID=200361 RepID=UPI001ABC81F4|nr:uncharacterized protein LOC120966636 [Aegilops tauschii subsp. strangulata]
MVYRIFYEVEEVVDEGWAKNEDELSQGYEDWMDFQLEEEESRDPKKAKIDDVDTVVIHASTRTKMAMEDRDVHVKEQEEKDKLMYYKNQDNEKMRKKDEETGSTSVNGGEVGEAGKEIQDKTNDDELGEELETSKSVSLGTKLGINGQEDEGMVNNNNSEGNQGLPRYNGRIASKNMDDIPILDRTMTLARAKNLALSEGEGGKKGGATTGRKVAGTSRQ